MRILIASVATPRHRLGGMERHLLMLTSAFRTLGHEVHWLTTPGGTGPTPEGAMLHEAAGARPAHHGPSWWRASAELAARLHATTPFDLACSEGLSGIGLLGWKGGPPLWTFMHGVEPEHLSNQWREVRSAIDAVKYALVRAPETLAFSVAERRLTRGSALVLCAAPHQREKAVRWYGLDPARAVWFPNWVEAAAWRRDEPARAKLRSEFDIADDEVAFLFASVLSRQKGALDALEAFDAHAQGRRRTRLLIAGSGPETPVLKVRTLRLGLVSRVHFLGEKPPEAMPKVASAADAFVFPTRRIEAVPFALLEAAAAGLPCIASRIGGNEAALGAHAVWLEPGDRRGLVEAYDHLAAEPALRASLGEGARARVTAEFTERQAVERLRGHLAGAVRA